MGCFVLEQNVKTERFMYFPLPPPDIFTEVQMGYGTYRNQPVLEPLLRAVAFLFRNVNLTFF